MNSTHVVLSKLTGSIYRSTQAYTNEIFKQYKIGSASYPYLLTLFHNEGINQNQISKELDVDKALSAREIKKLIEVGYVYKEVDPDDSRAFKLYLTDQGKSIIPDIKEGLFQWNEMITQGLNVEEKEDLVRLLNIVLLDIKKCRNIPNADRWR